MDEDLVEVENISESSVNIWWGSECLYFQSHHKMKVPRTMAKAICSHESYGKELRINDENAKDEKPKETETSKEWKTDPTRTTATKGVLEPWSDPDWDPLTCGYDDVVRYATKFNLRIPVNDRSESLRQIVDEHFIDKQG